MLIRCTAHACFVILPNGLTLELCYDHDLGLRQLGERRSDSALTPSSSSYGVWIFREEVLGEAKVGQA